MRGQRLLDNAPCQAVAGLDSGALLFPRYCASLVQTKADRHANGSPFGATATTAASGGNREELLGQRPAGCERQRSRRWEPQPGLGEELATRLRGLGRCQTALRRDSIALIKSLPIAAPAPLSCRACPLRHCFAMPPLPKGEALAGRITFHWTPEARQDAKGRALLTGTAASGQRSLSSCRWPRQRSTAASEILCFARPDES